MLSYVVFPGDWPRRFALLRVTISPMTHRVCPSCCGGFEKKARTTARLYRSVVSSHS